MMDRLTLALLGVWAFLFGLFAVSNLRIEWMSSVMGFAALVLGVVCLVRVVVGYARGG